MEPSFSGQSSSIQAWWSIKWKNLSYKELHNGAERPSCSFGCELTGNMLWEYETSRNVVEKDWIGFYKIKYSFHSICTFILVVVWAPWENVHPKGIYMFVCGMTGERANCFILASSFWLISGKYILWIFWESVYVLLIIIMLGTSVVLS